MEDRRKKPETLRLREVMPTLTVGDLATSLAFYRDVLGFVVDDVMEQDGKPVGASIKAGLVEFLLVQDDFAKERERAKGIGFRLYCVTHQDIDRVARDIEARGGELVRPPQDQPWGTRDFAVVDPDGFNLSISTPMPG